MSKRKFDPELASEMTWSECVLVASEDTNRPDATTWVCGCGQVMHIKNQEQLNDTAQIFLDAGWRYRRTSDGMDAVCPNCRSRK